MSDPALLWFRLDLRLTDNPALLAALSQGGPVIPVFIWSPEEEGRWRPGAASRWWLHQSLAQLDASLRQRGSRLIVRAGPALEMIRGLLDETGATAVYWNRRYEPAVVDRDRRLERSLREGGWSVKNYNGSLLFEPCGVRSQQGEPYQVFSAFWKACLASQEPAPPGPAPGEISASRRWPATLLLEKLDLEPQVDWAGGLRSSWRPGEVGALAELNRFLEEDLADYPTRRDRPDQVGTSRLSPHLHFGEISPRQVWEAVRRARHGRSTAGQSLPEGTRLARVRPSSLVPLSAHARAAPPGEFRRLSVEARRQPTALLAARADRLPDRRRGHARALADGLDAQSRANDRGLVPRQGLTDFLAGWGVVVLGHPGRCRPGE